MVTSARRCDIFVRNFDLGSFFEYTLLLGKREVIEEVGTGDGRVMARVIAVSHGLMDFYWIFKVCQSLGFSAYAPSLPIFPFTVSPFSKAELLTITNVNLEK